MYKYSILMYNFNNYELFREPEAIDPNCEYIYVTDNENLQSSKWKIIVDKDLYGLSAFDKCYKVRFNLFNYVSTMTCIYLDGSIQIHKSLRKLYNKFIESNADLGLCVHPGRSTLKEEYEVWLAKRNYDYRQFQKAKAFAKAAGYDFDNYKGLYQGGCRIVKNTELNQEIDNFVYNSLKKLGTKDKIERLGQTIYSLILNKFYENEVKVFPFSQQILQSDYMHICPHGSRQLTAFDEMYATPKYVFNKLRTDIFYLRDT